MTTPKDTVEDWESEKFMFEVAHLLLKEGYACRDDGNGDFLGKLTRKVSNLLHATEARVRKEMLEKDIEELEGMRKAKAIGVDIETDDKNLVISGYNSALTTLLTRKKKALKALTPKQ